MIQALPARDITLHALTKKFGLRLIENEQFFREWQDDLPQIPDLEKRSI